MNDSPAGPPQHQYRCPVCASSEFVAFNGRENARCKSCLMMERTRLMWMVFEKLGIFKPGLRVLHIAPELAFARRFTELSGDLYHACDIDPARYKSRVAVMRPLDLCTDLVKLPSRSFDLILHSHVLEHIACDVEGVLKEMDRILAPGGHHFFCVPVRGEETEEDISDLLSPEDRKRLFGQEDHMRLFGSMSLTAMLDRVWGKSGGHAIEPLELFSEEELQRAAVPPEGWTGISGHTVFHHQKPATPTVTLKLPAAPRQAPAAPAVRTGARAPARYNVIFHIGTPRTGTAVLQGWMSQNRTMLLDHGIDYWDRAENHSELSFFAFAQERRIAQRAMWFQRSSGNRYTKNEALALFMDFVKGLGGRSGFVSAETIWSLTPAEVADLAAFLNKEKIFGRFLCWVKPPADYFSSVLQQRAMVDLTTSQMLGADAKLVPVANTRLEEWIKVFGRAPMLVQAYRPDILASLVAVLRQLGFAVPPPAQAAAPEQTISLTAAKAMLALNDALLARTGDEAVRAKDRRLAKLLLGTKGRDFAPPVTATKSLLPLLSREQAYLAARFPGAGWQASASVTAVEDDSYRHFTSEEVGQILAAVNDLLGRLQPPPRRS